MDIISMQIANKVIKKMNTEYNGLYETVVATEGQKSVAITKDFGVLGNVLKVFVDGILAVEGTDYTITDTKTVNFVDGLQAGNVVLFTTNIAGIPKFVVTNPEYDDTELRGKVEGIITALDADSDGSILDTIDDIKTQWEAADSSLKLLIEDKVSTAIVEGITSEMTEAKGGKLTLKEKLDEIIASIPVAYEDAVVKADIAQLKTDVSQNTSDALELKTKVEGIITALDEDSDGTIIDTIADLKSQWAAADGSLQTLVDNKAEKTALELLQATVTGKAEATALELLQTTVAGKAEKTELEALAGTVSGKADATALGNYREKATEIVETDFSAEVKAKLNAIATPYDDAALAEKVTALEGKTIYDLELTDATTFKKYKLKVDNGILSVEEIIE